jgi:hypothetical protein
MLTGGILPLIFHTSRGPIKFNPDVPDGRSDCVIILVNTTRIDWKLTLERWIGNTFNFRRLTVVVVGFSAVGYGDRYGIVNAAAAAPAVDLVEFHQKYNMPFPAVSDWTRSSLQKPFLELA